MQILVTGATGYIGSHTCVELLTAGYDVIGLDNFINSQPDVLKKIKTICGRSVTFYEGDVTSARVLQSIFAVNRIDAVIHFAGLKAVGESVAKPLEYYRNNLLSTINLCQAMQQNGVKKIIFSSSANVYGAPQSVPIREDFPLSATNPYGTTKLMCEQILQDVVVADTDWSVCLLRYFNPIGAHSSGLIGEEPNGIPNNLMPYIVKVAKGQLPNLNVFGNDYPTHDGTGVRDYIHVVDLALGHVKAITSVVKKSGVNIYNLGTGNGYSVLDLVETFKRVNNIEVPYVIGARRPGDIAECYADPTKARQELGWTAIHSSEDMCRDSWNYGKK